MHLGFFNCDAVTRLRVAASLKDALGSVAAPVAPTPPPKPAGSQAESYAEANQNTVSSTGSRFFDANQNTISSAGSFGHYDTVSSTGSGLASMSSLELVESSPGLCWDGHAGWGIDLGAKGDRVFYVLPR